ncbi:MAG: esterase/lipase family protein [Phycisphaerales bacterium JB040]
MTNPHEPSHDDAQQDRPSVRARLLRLIARAGIALGTFAAFTFGASCVHLARDNPDYAASDREVREQARRLRDEPVTLERPVLVLSGYRSPAGSAWILRDDLEELTGDDRIHSLSYPLADTIEDPARQAVALVERLYPSDDPEWTTEVDVVAISMGGLVARLAAADPALRGADADGDRGKRLKIGTLYTLASPHRGAVMAERVRPDQASRDMAPGSSFLSALDAELASAGFEIVPYAVLRDGMVGATNTAPPGQEPIWVPGRLIFSHFLIALEDRIKTDVALRLRGETPLGSPGEPPRD